MMNLLWACLALATTCAVFSLGLFAIAMQSRDARERRSLELRAAHDAAVREAEATRADRDHALRERAIEAAIDRHARDLQLREDQFAFDREKAQRELDQRDRELALRENGAKNPELPRVEEFPIGLRRLVENESEEWARNDVIRIVHEEWVHTSGDWEKAATRVLNRFRGQDATEAA